MKKIKYLLGCFGLTSLILFSECSNSEKDAKILSLPVNVEVQRVRTYNDNDILAYSGTIEESESIPLSFSGMGTVSKVYVSEGDFVKKGQILAELNDETSRNAYELSSASLKQAEDAYKRLLPMYKNGNLPEIKFVEVETGLQQAKAAAAISKKNLNDCKLYSTTDGIIGKRSVDPGMNALPGMASITIVKIEKVFARVSISENEIATIKKGKTAKIKIPALNNVEFTGIIEEIGVMADPIAHTYKIKIGISNKNKDIKPGMICNVNIETGGVGNGLFVPERAVLIDEKGENFVYVVDSINNMASRKYVSTGRLMRKGIEITAGLSDGEIIVIAGQQKLVDNSKVNIVNK